MTSNAPHRVLLLETIDPAAMGLFERQAGGGVEVVLAASPTELDCLMVAREMSETGPVHAILTRGKGRVTPGLLDACPGLLAVARCGVGLDNVDISACTARGAPVLNLPGVNAQTIAEHAVMLMLAVTRGLVESANAVRDGDWASRAAYDRDEVNGQTVGIVGLGNIGSRVARVCEALGMGVLYHDPRPRDSAHESVALDELLRRSDVVTLHCQLDERSTGMMDQNAMNSMKPGSVLINTARGGLIDHAALTRAMRSGHLAGFGADVLDAEPPESGNPLLALPNVVVTPHSASLTRSTYREICVRSVKNTLAILAGEAPEPGCVFNGAALAERG